MAEARCSTVAYVQTRFHRENLFTTKGDKKRMLENKNDEEQIRIDDIPPVFP